VKLLRMADLDLAGKRVLIREDLNVPITDGMISSDARVRAALPTLRSALEQRARVIVLSHLGRPEEGKYDPQLSLGPVAAKLSELLGKPVPLRREWLEGVECAPGSLVLCENVRFNKGEKKDSDALSRQLAALCDVFGEIRPDRLCRSIARGRARSPGARARQTGPTTRGDRCRLQGLDQAHAARVAARARR
jgi:phosphoglycerate kinase